MTAPKHLRPSDSGRFLLERRNVHVEPSNGQWVVRRESDSGAHRVYPSKDEAVRQGREIAKREGVDHVVHGRDGRIRERDSYSPKD